MTSERTKELTGISDFVSECFCPEVSPMELATTSEISDFRRDPNSKNAVQNANNYCFFSGALTTNSV